VLISIETKIIFLLGFSMYPYFCYSGWKWCNSRNVLTQGIMVWWTIELACGFRC